MRKFPGGGTLIYKPYRYVPPQRVGFLLLTLLISVWNWARFSRELRECTDVFIVSILNELERKPEACEFVMDFKKSVFVAVVI